MEQSRIRGWIIAVLIVIIEASSAVVLAWFGAHDIGSSLTFPVRLQAAMMIATATILAVAAIGALVFQRKGSHVAGALVMLGGATTSIVGLFLSTSQLLYGDFTAWLWAWLAMTVGGAWVVIQVLRAGERPPYPKQFALAVTLTGVIAVANFAYTSLYLPSAQSYQWALEVNFGKPAFSPKGTSASIPIKLTFNNKGKVGLYVLAATYSVRGRRTVLITRDEPTDLRNLTLQLRRQTSRHTLIDGYDLLQMGEFIGQGTWFQPGDRADISSTVDVLLPTPYDAIVLEAFVLVMRRDRGTPKFVDPSYSWDSHGKHLVDAPEWVTSPGIDAMRYQVPIAEGSYLREHTRKDWIADIWWALGESQPFTIWRVALASKSDADQPELKRNHEQAAERYGIVAQDTGPELVSAYSLGLSKPPAPRMSQPSRTSH